MPSTTRHQPSAPTRRRPGPPGTAALAELRVSPGNTITVVPHATVNGAYCLFGWNAGASAAPSATSQMRYLSESGGLQFSTVSVAESKGEIAYAAEFFRWNAGEALRIDGDYKVAGNGASRVMVMRQPVGPCYLITPWNFPIAMGTRKIGPAIAAGCTMVMKPAQQTPLSMLALAALLEECGLPAGVLNIVTSTSSSGVSKPIIGDPRLRKLSFTGSTEVGRMLIEQSAENVLKTSMELGGNAPFLVFEDADLDAAVEGAMIAKMRNVGEACTSANRFHVARVGRRGVRRASWPSGWARSRSAAAPRTASRSGR